MRLWRLAALTALAASPFATARAQSDDTAVQYLGHDAVAAAFAKGTPMIEVRDYKIHASRREGPGRVEVHTRDTDIAYVLQGSATLVTGRRRRSASRRSAPRSCVAAPSRAVRPVGSSRAMSSSSPTARPTGSRK